MITSLFLFLNFILSRNNNNNTQNNMMLKKEKKEEKKNKEIKENIRKNEK